MYFCSHQKMGGVCEPRANTCKYCKSQNVDLVKCFDPTSKIKEFASLFQQFCILFVSLFVVLHISLAWINVGVFYPRCTSSYSIPLVAVMSQIDVQSLSKKGHEEEEARKIIIRKRTIFIIKRFFLIPWWSQTAHCRSQAQTKPEVWKVMSAKIRQISSAFSFGFLHQLPWLALSMIDYNATTQVADLICHCTEIDGHY